MRYGILISLFSILFLSTGCPGDEADDDVADDDTADDDDADDDVADDDAGDDDTGPQDSTVGTATVPPEYAATPLQFTLYYFASPGGEPDGIGLQLKQPEIDVDTPLDFAGHQAGLHGEHVVVAILWVEGGGGEGQPAKGIDWWWKSDDPETLGEGPLDLGTIALGLYPN